MKNAFLAVCCAAAVAAAQIVFQRIYGGEDSEYGYAVRQPSEGGYIMVGKTESFGAGDFDVWLVRTDRYGDTMWTRTYGGPDNDFGWSLAQTPDEGCIIAANTKSFGAGDWDAWLIKTDKYGDSAWTRTLGGAFYENIFSVLVTPDSGYIISGWADSSGTYDTDLWLVRTDQNGATMWTRTYGGPAWDVGMSIAQTADGGYIIAGSTQSFGAGERDVWLVRTDALGDTLWTRTYGGPSLDMACSALQTPDDGFVVAGFTASFGAGAEDFWLLKTDSMGDTAWTRTYGGSVPDRGRSVDMTADGGYVIVGSTGSAAPDCWLIKTDSNGETSWTRTYGDADSDGGMSVEQTPDGGYIIAGHTYGRWVDAWLIKTDSVGLLAVEEPEAPCVREAAAATIISGALRYQPASGNSQQTADLLDIAGRRVMELRPGANDIRSLSPGIYFVRRVEDNATGKVVIQH